jgi:subtilase family serine protease
VVVIVSFGSPTLKQDLDVYDQTFSLPPADVQVSSPLQIPESDPHQSKEGWANTTTLDVEVIHAIAPEARIVVLTSPVAETEGTTGLAEFRQLEQYALDNKLGGVILQSWEISELTLQNQVGQQELQQWDSLFRQATTQQGVTFFASSGDNGAADYADPDGKALAADPAVGFPASSPWVTAVGGTSLSGQSANQTEHAWSGSGGGFSKLFQAPDHQKTSVANYLKQGNNQRGVPDVAAVADPATSLVMYRNGKWTMAAGTSTSASIWAAMMAIADGMANHPLGFINPTLYKLAGANSQDFRDIIDGNNTNQNAGVEGYAAAAGWDPVTGLGVPKADKLLMDLTVSIGGAS